MSRATLNEPARSAPNWLGSKLCSHGINDDFRRFHVDSLVSLAPSWRPSRDRQGRGGRGIKITSLHEDWPMPGEAPCGLWKSGMRMLTRAAGMDIARDGVLVVGVGPDAIVTPINPSAVSDPAKTNTLYTAIPLGQMAEWEEIGSVVASLAGHAASLMTATAVVAGGGMIQSSPGL